MTLKKTTLSMAILLIAFFSLSSCDNEFKEIGGELVDSKNFEALKTDAVQLKAESVELQKIQTSSLTSYAVGVLKNEKFGETTAGVLAQMRLSPVNPNFGENPVLDSVSLVIPYYSTEKERDGEKGEYALDSIFGEGSFKLSLYHSNYFLRDYDPNDNFDTQVYYSSDGDQIEANLVGTPLYEKEDFKPSKKEITVKNLQSSEGELMRQSPALKINLPATYFKELILDKQGSDVLANNDNFQNYFRGLYLKAEDNGSEGVYGLLNFRSEDAGVILYYHNEVENSDGETEKQHDAYKLNFDTRLINVFAMDKEELTNTADNLYVKGGEGVITVVDLFLDENQLNEYREKKWLINEANLKFYVNTDDLPEGYSNPQRIFVYDYKNGRVLKDYENAMDIRENEVVDSRTAHMGRLQKDEEGNWLYKIRITDYVHDIINNDSTNTRLGIAVSQNVNDPNFVRAQTKDQEKISVPRSSVLAPEGTLFYNTEFSSDQALKLEIYYTESK